MTPGRLAHLKLEVAANDRRLRTYQPNVSREALRLLEHRHRKMRNVGMRPENAMNPAWDWLSPSTFSSLNTCTLKSDRAASLPGTAAVESDVDK
jgi:hypothetical protein